MTKRVIPSLVLTVYGALLVKIMVLKDVPMIRVGKLMLNFGGAQTTGQSNLIPFKTILSYILSSKGIIIVGINLIGNIALLVPVGFIAPFVFQNNTWRKAIILAASAGLALEVLQVILRVGIFDIDDVILNGLGVIIGYWACLLSKKLLPPIFES
jgi:glycopeptide antibiotics resistance protein